MLGLLDKIIKRRESIWKYADFYVPKIAKSNRLALRDGGTTLLEDRKLSSEAGLEHLYMKREDENSTGSLKGRSLAYQMSLQKQRGAKAIVLSTSGNAGVAAAAYAREAGIKAFIFISPSTEGAKIADMQQYAPVIIRSQRAMRLANYAAAKYKLSNLRPSVDDTSIEGFKSIAFELAQAKGEIDAVFTFVTSGSSFVGIYRGFEAYRQADKLQKLPRLYAVQSGEIYSIAEEFEENGCMIASENITPDGPSAGRLGVKHTQRKSELLEIIRETGGRGVYVSGQEIQEAEELLRRHHIETSAEGCASLAALVRMNKQERFRSAVCIFSGKKRSVQTKPDETGIYGAESFEEVDGIITHNL